MAIATVSIAHRFRGPANSGNGGYVCGAIAEAVVNVESQPSADPMRALAVRLRAPPPLDRPLQLHAVADGGYKLTDDAAEAVQIADATWQTFPVAQAPAPVPWESARAARRRFDNPDPALFGGCFVCGMTRAAGDGLRISPGLVGEQVATLWAPDASLPESGLVPHRYLWAALDCPGYFAVTIEPELLLLAQMSARIIRQPRTDETLLVQAWPLGRSGRSRMAGTALYDSAGEVVAIAHTRWVAPRA